MKKLILLLSLCLMGSVQADVVQDFLQILPVGTHKGQDCKVIVDAGADYFYLTITDDSGKTLVTHAYTKYNEVVRSELEDNNLDIKFIQHPDDGYSGKDVVFIRVKDRTVNLKVKDFGPLGLLFNTKSARCDLK